VILLTCSGVETVRYSLVNIMCNWNNGSSKLEEYTPLYSKGSDIRIKEVEQLLFNIDTTHDVTVVINPERDHNFFLLEIIEVLLDLLSAGAHCSS